MQRLRDTDGTPTHRKAIRFHIAKCRAVNAPLHKQLLAEAAAAYDDLKTKSRSTVDADDDATDAGAEADSAEIALENAIRDLDNDLERLDRDTPGLNARIAVFPEGFGVLIDPEGDAQLGVLPALHVRLGPFTAQVSKASGQLDAAEAAFRGALGVEEKGGEAFETAFAQELSARKAVREQLESAHARLRDFYKSRPAQAEPFFMRLASGPRKGKEAKVPNTHGGTKSGATTDEINLSPPNPHAGTQGGATADAINLTPPNTHAGTQSGASLNPTPPPTDAKPHGGATADDLVLIPPNTH